MLCYPYHVWLVQDVKVKVQHLNHTHFVLSCISWCLQHCTHTSRHLSFPGQYSQGVVIIYPQFLESFSSSQKNGICIPSCQQRLFCHVCVESISTFCFNKSAPSGPIAPPFFLYITIFHRLVKTVDKSGQPLKTKQLARLSSWAAYKLMATGHAKASSHTQVCCLTQWNSQCTPNGARYVQNILLLHTWASQSKHADHSLIPLFCRLLEEADLLSCTLQNWPFFPGISLFLSYVEELGYGLGKSTVNFSHFDTSTSWQRVQATVSPHTLQSRMIWGYKVCMVQDWTDHLWPAPGYSERPCEATEPMSSHLHQQDSLAHLFIFGLAHVKRQNKSQLSATSNI